MTPRFDLVDTPLAGLREMTRKPLADARGYFERFFCTTELADVLEGRSVVQINHSKTLLPGTVRGMHFQTAPHAEMKIVTCVRGAVFDVAVDVRQDSPTYLQWHAVRLTEDNHKTLIIPEGFAHGFQALSEGSELIYLCTAAYSPAHDSGLSPEDPALSIDWPLPIALMSEKDRGQPPADTVLRGSGAAVQRELA